jgi:hypothetical protein
METFILFYTILEVIIALVDTGLFIASIWSDHKYGILSTKSDHIDSALGIVNGILIVVVLIYFIGIFPLIAPTLF